MKEENMVGGMDYLVPVAVGMAGCLLIMGVGWPIWILVREVVWPMMKSRWTMDDVKLHETTSEIASTSVTHQEQLPIVKPSRKGRKYGMLPTWPCAFGCNRTVMLLNDSLTYTCPKCYKIYSPYQY